jgi:hypothetical protein
MPPPGTHCRIFHFSLSHVSHRCSTRSFSMVGPSLINGLPIQIKPTHALPTFPRKLAYELEEKVPPPSSIGSDAIPRSTGRATHVNSVGLVTRYRIA